MADYTFTIDADASGIERAVEAAMGKAQAIASGKQILLSFTGDQKSAQAFIKQIQSLKPEATITFQSDKKSMESLLKGFENKDAFKFDPSKTGIKNSFNDLQNYVEQNLSGVNLTKYFQNISSAILDPGKYGGEVLKLIESTSLIFKQLSSLKNKDALKVLDEKQLDQVLAKIIELNDVQSKYETAREEADKKVDQYGFTDDERKTILNRTKGEYAKKSLAEARKRLGIPETTYNGLTKQEKSEIDDYIKLSLGLKDQFEGRKTGEDFQDALKTSAGAEKLIESRKKMLNLFDKLEAMRNKIGIKSGATKELMGSFDRNLVAREMNLARNAFTDIKTSTQKTAVANAERALQETIIRNTERAVRQTQKGADEAQTKAERAIERSNAGRRGGGQGTGSGGGTGTGTGAGTGNGSPDELADGLNNAADGAERLGNAGQNIGNGISSGLRAGTQSLEELNNKLKEAEEKLNKLQSGNKSVSDIKTPLEFRNEINQAIKDYDELITNKAAQADIDKQGKKVLDLIKTYDEGQFGKSFGTYKDYQNKNQNGNWKERLETISNIESSMSDYTPKILESLGDTQAIQEQIKLIQDLKQQIRDFSTTGTAGGGSTPAIDNVTESIENLKNKIDEAKNKLKELQDGIDVKNATPQDFKSAIQSAIDETEKLLNSDLDKVSQEQIDEATHKVLDLVHTAQQLKKMPTLSDDYRDLIEGYQEGYGDYTPRAISKIIDETAIQNQLNLVDNLTSQLTELESKASKGTGDKSGSAGSTAVNVDNVEQTVENINKVKKALEDLPESKDIAINITGGVDELDKIKTGLDNLPESKKIQISVEDNGFFEKLSKTFSGKNSISELLQGWHEADTIKDNLDMALQERVAAYNSSTGYITNPHLFDAADTISAELLEKVITDAKNQADTLIHTHPTDVAAPSPEDFSTAITALKDGFTKSVVMGLEEVTTLDLSGVSKESLLQIESLFKQKVSSISEKTKTDLKKTGSFNALNVAAVENSKEYQNSIKNALFDSVKEINLNPSDIIKVESTDDFINGIKGKISGAEKQKFELDVDTDGLRSKIESALSNPFKINVEVDGGNVRDEIQKVIDENSKSPISSEVSVLDKKVAELQYLHDKVRTIFDGKDGIINEDMTYSKKFDSSEVQRMIELLSQLSDAELKAAGVTPDDEDSYDSFRQDLQERISLIKEAQDEIEKVKNGQSDEDRTELDLNIARQLEGIYGMAEEVGAKFESRLTPSVKEFLSLIEDNLGINSMSDFMMGNAQEIDRYINDIIHNGKSVKEVFADMENRYGWDTARFDNLIEGNVPTELKGLYDSLFSDVENRIKSAEQAAEEFNAKLREFQSNETPVSEDTTTAQSPDKIEAEAKAHEDAAEAAEKHAEAAREANKVGEEKSQTPDTSNADEQTKANEQEAESAREAAKAEEERRKATEKANDVPDAGSQSAKASVEEKTSAFITEQETVANATDAEINSLNQLKESLKGVSESVEAKTDAFTAEQETVSSVVDAEVSSLNQLKESLKSVSESVEAIGKSFEGFGKDSPFSSMFGDIKDNADTIKNFSDILKTSKEARDQAMKDAETAKEATDKVINEEKVDPGKWADFIKDKKDLDKLINELGGTVDVRRQTRVSEKTGEQYISYALKGEKGNAIIGKNGHILRTNIDEDMALSQQKEAAKQHANDVKNSYNDLISAMKEYGDAAEYVNKLQADIMSGKDVTDDEMDKALERRDKAAQNYIEKLQTIKNLVKEEGFTDKQIEGINRTADEVTKQIKDSEDNITIAANNKEYQDQIEIIQKAIEARNEYNKMLANEANGQIIPKDDRKRITDTLNEAEDAKAKALDTIKQLRDEQRISEEQFNVANTKYEKGTKASYDNLDKAMSNRVKKQEQAIERYDNAVQKVQAIQDKYNVGEATAKQLQNAIDKMNEYKTGAEEAMGVLIKMHDEGSKFVPDETIDKYRTMLDDAKETSGIFGIGDDKGFETAERGYQTLIKNAERYAQIIEKKNNGQALTFNELSFLSKYGEYYQQAAENAGIFKNAQTEATESMEEFNRVMADAQNNAFQGTLGKMGNTLADFGKNTWNKEGINSLEDLNKQYNELIANANNYKDLSKEEQQAFRKRVTDFGNNISQFAQRGRAGYLTDADEKDQETLRRRMAEWMHKNSAATEYFPQIQNLQDAINGASAGNLDEIAAAFERIKTQATEAGDVGKSFGETLKGSFKGMARYLLTYADLYEVINIAKQGVNIVRELDTALTEMRKVSDEPLSVLKDFAQHGSFEAADRVGTTSKQIQESTADWLRLGESFEQAQKSAEQSTVLLNVSEFQDINAATESLTAMSQAYKDLDKTEIIDKLNYVGRFCLITQ